MAKKVTKGNAEKVLAGVKKLFKAYTDGGNDGPVLVKDWDWVGGPPVPWAIIWEGGPYEWSYLVPNGGIDQEFGLKFGPIDVPDGVYIEHETSWAIGIYPTD